MIPYPRGSDLDFNSSAVLTEEERCRSGCGYSSGLPGSSPSLLVGLFVAAILAKLGQEFSSLIEFDPLESPPPQTFPVREEPSRKSASWRVDPPAYGS